LSFAAMLSPALTPSGGVRLIGRCPDAGPPGYFRTRDRVWRARVTRRFPSRSASGQQPSLAGHHREQHAPYPPGERQPV